MSSRLLVFSFATLVTVSRKELDFGAFLRCGAGGKAVAKTGKCPKLSCLSKLWPTGCAWCMLLRTAVNMVQDKIVNLFKAL